MGVGSNFVNSFIDTVSDTNSGTNLQQFLNKFGSSAGKYAEQLNPLATFDVNIKFYPTISSKSIQNISTKDKIKGLLGSTVTSMATNLGNNLTGGLLTSLLNKTTVESERKDFDKAGEHTFLEYLAKANLLVGGENWFKSEQSVCPLELQLSFYIQSIVVPKLKIPDGAKIQTSLGEFSTNGNYVIPDNNNLQLYILCTKLPLHERIFYPWMREVTLPYWSYATQPYTTATITIDFNKHTDLKYVFCGCRPTSIDTIQPTQEPNGSITRQVTFLFDFMFIESNDTTIESVENKLLSTGKTLLNSAGKMMNF